MSLINDALKRAQGQPSTPGSSPAGVPVQQQRRPGVPGAPATRASSGGKPNIALLVVLGAMIAGVAYYYLFPSKPVSGSAQVGKTDKTDKTDSEKPAKTASSTKPTKRVSITGAVASRTDDEEDTAAPTKPKFNFLEIFNSDVKNSKTKTNEAEEEPAAPPSTTKGRSSDGTDDIRKLRVKGVILSASKGKVALIGDQAVSVGEQIAGANVIEIDEQNVTLRHRGKEIKLPVP